MRKFLLLSLEILSTILLCLPIYAQSPSDTCEVFEEQDGLLVIEMENLPLTEDWEIANSIEGATGNAYIQWTGKQYFNQVGQGRIHFRIKINNPGNYNFNWRVAVGAGEETSEHNDSWLKIGGSRFYAKKGFIGQSFLKPKPSCNSDPNFDCPNGSSTQGFFKIFGGQLNQFEWKAKTSDHDSHDILATFDTAGIYTVEINARSSFHCIDRMIMWLPSKQKKVNAEKPWNRQSPCANNFITSTSMKTSSPTFKVFPNPVVGHFFVESNDSGRKTLILKNLYGQAIRSIQSNHTLIQFDATSIPTGVYYIEVQKDQSRSVQKILIN